jgi:hypothetical protein
MLQHAENLQESHEHLFTVIAREHVNRALSREARFDAGSMPKIRKRTESVPTDPNKKLDEDFNSTSDLLRYSLTKMSLRKRRMWLGTKVFLSFLLFAALAMELSYIFGWIKFGWFETLRSFFYG